MTISIGIKALLEFFDEKPEGSSGHATAICAVMGEELGVALLQHYLTDRGSKTTIISDKCTTGKSKGHRLDWWVSKGRYRNHILYQVEVKNWSAHSFGGRCLPLDSSDDETSAYKIERWSQLWRKGNFTHETVGKVLEPMKPPPGYELATIEPLVCFWTAVHPTGDGEPLFRQRVRNGNFSSVTVFSMSAYLRNLRSMGKRRLWLEMPRTAKRLAMVNEMVRR